MASFYSDRDYGYSFSSSYGDSSGNVYDRPAQQPRAATPQRPVQNQPAARPAQQQYRPHKTQRPTAPSGGPQQQYRAANAQGYRTTPERAKSAYYVSSPENDPYANYRPGTMLGTSGKSASGGFGGSAPTAQNTASVPSYQNAAYADPRLEDDFGPTPLEYAYRQPSQSAAQPQQYQQAQRRRNGLGYDVYNDYSEEAFSNEFGSIKGIGSNQRRSNPDDFVPSDDGYDAKGTMRDQPFQGGAVPAVFAEWFGQEYIDSLTKPRKKHNNYVGSGAFYVSKRSLVTTLAVLVVASVVGVFALFGSTSSNSVPLEVSTALTTMNSETSTMLIKTSVDQILEDKSFIVQVGDSSGTFMLSNFEFEYSTLPDGTEEVVEYIEYDENGKEIVGEYVYVTVGSLRFNKTLVREYLNDLGGVEAVMMIEPAYTIDYDKGVMTITDGSDGYGIEYDTFINEVIQRLSTNDENNVIQSIMQVTEAPEVDIEAIHEHVCVEVADAYKVTDGSGKTNYFDEVIGVKFNLSDAKSLIANGGTKNKDGVKQWKIDLTLTQPQVTKKFLMQYEYPDLLATYSTTFNENNKARVNNVIKCCEYIMAATGGNGYEMEPGDQFSFNGAVGERTAARGFSKATVYSTDGTDEDYGGGICQVSSTLYYTCIKANLQIDYRVNHKYTVSYMLDENGREIWGADATVNWGYIDYKFSNNKEYPIKVELYVEGNTLTCNIWGTWDGWTADLGIVERNPVNCVTIYRPANGQNKGNQKGQLGRTVYAYRIVYYNGEEVRLEDGTRILESVSVYEPLAQVYYTDNLPAGKQYNVEY